MRSKKAIVASILAVIVIAGVAIGAGVLWQSLAGSFKEAENAIDSYIHALNTYNATEAWILMAPTFRSDRTYLEFEEFVQKLESSHWRASVNIISSRFMETKNDRTTATFVLMTKITEIDPIVGTETYTEEWIFNLVNVDTRWMINEWLFQ